MNDIVEKAKELGICQKWGDEMQNSPQMGLYCKMYFQGEDWAMEQDFPTLSLLRKYKGQTEAHGLYTDHKGGFYNTEHLAFFGESDVMVSYDGFQVGKVNIRHDSKAKISLKGNAIIMLNVLDFADVEIEATQYSKAYVYQYGINAKVKTKGNVEMRIRQFGNEIIR